MTTLQVLTVVAWGVLVLALVVCGIVIFVKTH